MSFDSKHSPFEGMNPPRFSGVMTIFFCIALEALMGIMFYALYSETIALMTRLALYPMAQEQQRLMSQTSQLAVRTTKYKQVSARRM